MAKRKNIDLDLVCMTDDEGGGYTYAVLQISSIMAQLWLDGLRSWVKKLVKANGFFYGLEIFDYSIVYFDDPPIKKPAPDESPEHGKWTVIPLEKEIGRAAEVEACTLVATKDGILWKASPKNYGHEFETAELSWKDLEEIAAGRNPFSVEPTPLPKETP